MIQKVCYAILILFLITGHNMQIYGSCADGSLTVTQVRYTMPKAAIVNAYFGKNHHDIGTVLAGNDYTEQEIVKICLKKIEDTTVVTQCVRNLLLYITSIQRI